MKVQRNVLTEPEAHEIFKPIYPELNQIVSDSFRSVRELIEMQKAQGFEKFLPAVNAMNMYYYLVNHSIKMFGPKIGYKRDIVPVLYSKSRIFGLKYLDAAFIRFKKLDDDFMPSKGQTDQAKALNCQLDTGFFPSKPCIITIGYRVDYFWDELLNINMLCINSVKKKDVFWNIPIDREAVPHVEFDFTDFNEEVSYSVEKLIRTKNKKA
ncbi:MAG: hypothetical protein R2819_03070 [Allomuricauda sp.]